MRHRIFAYFGSIVAVSILATVPGLAQPCEVVDNGTGTVNLPPEGCGYLSPDDVHVIIAGLPAGTTIEVAVEHQEFFQIQRFPGGNLGGEIEQFQSILILNMTGTGTLAGFNRTMAMQAASEAHTGPRNAGDPVQTFPNDMFFLQGEIFGDPDFDSLSIVAGTAFGLPSPGSTTLTELPSGNFNVDSFFDITYRIDFQGAPGSILEGLGGQTTGSVRMGAGEPVPSVDPCVVVDNGTGTVTLPPDGCQYLSPDDVHVIIDGLPPGTEIKLDPIHDRFFDVQTQPGGSLGGEIETFNSFLTLHATGTGALAGFDRLLAVPMASEVHTGPRSPGERVQDFDNDMFQQQGEIFGDPDFDLLRITAGTGNGLPSPGHTTLTRLPSGDFNVDSFFDITYRIDFQGAPGSQLDGMAGSTTGTVQMGAGTPSDGCPAIPAGQDVFPSTAKLVLRTLSGPGSEPFVVRLSDVGHGPTTIDRQGEDTQTRTVQTEMLSMSLSGSHPQLGDVLVEAGSAHGLPASTGELRDVQKDPASCEFVSADSFFDVFVRVELPDTNQTLINNTPLRVQRRIHTLPPKDEPYENPFVQPVLLVDEATGQPVAEVLYERHHADPPFPPQGDDCFDTFLQAEIDLPGLGLFGHPLQFQGPTTVHRSAPGPLGLVCCATGIPCNTDVDCGPTDVCNCPGVASIQQQMTEMDMHGFDPLLGRIQLHPTQGPPSAGQSVSRQPGRTYPIDSFFDVFFDVELSDQGVTLHSDGSLRVSNLGSSGKDGVRNIPPDPGDNLGSSGKDGVAMIDDGGVPVGEVRNVQHIIGPPRDWQPPPPADEDCFDSWIHIQITIFNPFCEEELWLPGHFRVLRDSPQDPSGIGQEIIDTIMAKGLFNADSDCVGPLTARMASNVNQGSRGEVSSLAPAEFFPADSFFDIFVELDTGIGPLRTQSPIHMTTTVNSLPPEDGEIYFGPGTVIPLFDDSGQQIGEILEVAHEIHEQVECPAACKAHIEFGTAVTPTAPGGVDPKSVIDVGIPDGGGGVTYDVVRGNLIQLRNSGGDFGSAFCLQSDGPPIVIDTETPGPAVGGYFYVARDTFGDYEDTWNSLGPQQVGDRDVRIPAATCP